MRTDAVIAAVRGIDLLELSHWVERGWVAPDEAGGTWEFQDIDVARVRLIHTLRHDMEVGEDAVPLVLSLLDQVYDLRRTLRDVLEAVQSVERPLSEAMRKAVRDAVGTALSGRNDPP